MEEIKNTEQFIKDIEQSNNVHNVTWSKNIKSYVEGLNRIVQICNYKDIQSEISNDLRHRINSFIEKGNNPEFHIALVGAIKAGKSTLINAILGQDLASSSVTPETASLTKFKASKEKNYVKLKFYTKEEWKNLWKSVQDSKSDVFMEKYNNLGGDSEKDKWIGKADIESSFNNVEELKEEIKRWTSCNCVTHYFVKEVEVGLVGLDIPAGVVLVDTPGLDDPVRYRSDITRRYIDRANAVLVCVNAGALTGQELSTIYKVFANARYSKDKIYIIGTQLDKLNSPIEDWNKQKAEWIMQLKGKEAYNNERLAEVNILGVSAYVENICREHILLNENTMSNDIAMLAVKYKIIELTDFMINREFDFLKLSEQFRGETGYKDLKDKLYNEIIRKHSELLERELGKEYNQLKRDILYRFNMIKKRESELVQANKDTALMISNKRKDLKKNLKESKEEEKEIQNLLMQIEKVTTERTKKLFKQIDTIWRMV